MYVEFFAIVNIAVTHRTHVLLRNRKVEMQFVHQGESMHLLSFEFQILPVGGVFRVIRTSRILNHDVAFNGEPLKLQQPRGFRTNAGKDPPVVNVSHAYVCKVAVAHPTHTFVRMRPSHPAPAEMVYIIIQISEGTVRSPRSFRICVSPDDRVKQIN